MENQEEEQAIDRDEGISLNTGIGIFKKIFYAILGLVAIAVIGLFILQKITNVSYIKSDFNNNMSKSINNVVGETNKYQSSVSINGDVKFYAFPVPHIDIYDIELKNIMQDSYYYSLKIDRIRLYVSIVDLVAKRKIKVNKIEAIDGNLTAKHIEKLEYNLGNIVIENLKNKINPENGAVEIVLKNNSATIDGNNYKRELTNISLKSVLSNNKITASGSLISNKQNLNINLSMDKKNIVYFGKLDLNSQYFKINSNFEFNGNEKFLKGKTTFNILNLQLFSRAMFNSSNFLYRRIIDNANLNLEFDYSLLNNIASFNNIKLDGKNIRGTGNIDLNLANALKNVNLNIDFINLDNLIIKDVAAKNRTDESLITIFNEDFNAETIAPIPTLDNSDLKSTFNITIKDMMVNQKNILNTQAIFSYSNIIVFDKFSTELPGKSILSIDKSNMFSLKGEDFNELWSFFENSKSPSTENKIQFEANGKITFSGNKILISNIIFNINDLKSLNNVEIFLNSGISLMAVKSDIRYLDITSFMDKERRFVSNDTLKSKLLSLNNFESNMFVKFNIEKIRYNELNDNNYSFIIKTSRGLFSILDIDLNNRVNGNIAFSISKQVPLVNFNLQLKNIALNNNFDFTKLLFDLPMMDDIYGNLNIVGENLVFKHSKIDNFGLFVKISSGIFNIEKFNIDGFGGKCPITGFLDLKYNKKLNLTFAGCTAKLEDTAYLFSGMDNIFGNIGFSSVLYSEGQNYDTFKNNYAVKLDLVGSGIVIKNFGITELNQSLLKINDLEFLKSININNTLYNNSNESIFEKLSGSVSFSNKNHQGQINLDISRELINGKITGTFDLLPNSHADIDSYLNFILLTGNLQKPTPLTVLIHATGITPDKLSVSTNTKQVSEFLETIIASLETLQKTEEISAVEEAAENQNSI